MPLRTLFLLSLTAVTLTGCYDYPTETPTDLGPTRAKKPYQMFDGMGLDHGDDHYVLLATTRYGDLFEINVDAGTIGKLTAVAVLPGWTGITTDASGTLLTSSRPTGGASHLFAIDDIGQVIDDVGSMGMKQVSDIDVGNGIIYGNHSSDSGSRGELVTITPGTNSAPATPVGGLFSDVPEELEGLDGGNYFVNGGLSVAPDGTIWGIEAFIWGTSVSPAVGPRLFTIHPTEGYATSVIAVVDAALDPLNFGFDGLEITPEGRFCATRSKEIGGVYEINVSTGVATSLTLTDALGDLFTQALNGLESALALTPFETFSVTSSTLTLHPSGNPAGDSFILDALLELGDMNDGLNIDDTESFILDFDGQLIFSLGGGVFSRTGSPDPGGVFEYTNPGGPGLTRVVVDLDAGTLRVEGAGLTLNSLLGDPVAVNLRMGDDLGGPLGRSPHQVVCRPRSRGSSTRPPTRVSW